MDFTEHRLTYKLLQTFFFCFSDTLQWKIAAAFLSSLVYWLTVIYIIRYSLKCLLIYKGWMYETRGKNRQISTKTKMWLYLVKVFSGWNTPKLYSYQGSLPRLPLPSIHDTMLRVSTVYLMQ